MYFFIRQFPELRSLSKEESRVVLRRVPWTLYPLPSPKQSLAQAKALVVAYRHAVI